MTIDQAREQWYMGRRVEGVHFALKDSVDVCGGASSGSGGAIISLEALPPDPVYLVELGSGKDVLVPQSLLRQAGEPFAAPDNAR
jgi:hypothetical protein